MYHQKFYAKNKQAKYGAAYILPNGEILRCFTYGFLTHTDYENSLIRRHKLSNSSNDYGRQLTNLNQWIRINDGTNIEYEVLAELPIKGITEEQYKSLFEFIDYLRANGKPFIEMGCEEHSRGTHFSDKSLWYMRFELDIFTNQEIEYFIRDEYRIRKIYSEEEEG